MKGFGVQDVTLHYAFQQGEQDLTLVFINSLGTDFRIWDQVMESLGNAHSTLRFDKRGHGLSSLGKVNKGSISLYVDDLAALCAKLGLEKIVLVGLSIGGLISLDFAARYPEKLAGIIFMDTAAKIGTKEGWTQRIEAIESQGMKAVAPTILTNWFAPSYQTRQPEAFALYENMLQRADAMGYTFACEAIRDADYTAIAKELKLPVCCAVGSEDRSTPVALVASFAALMQECQLTIIPGSGHLPCVDNPTHTSTIIQNFLSKI
ncbi:MAG: 3-oxoadipate enol-lactonase [Flavobacteriales bacterium]|nr:3-oxoadipate enol-lactonase [Flavobacteriales bacterium]